MITSQGHCRGHFVATLYETRHIESSVIAREQANSSQRFVVAMFAVLGSWLTSIAPLCLELPRFERWDGSWSQFGLKMCPPLTCLAVCTWCCRAESYR